MVAEKLSKGAFIRILFKKGRGLSMSELRKLRQLEEENHQLKKLVADLSLDKQMLHGVLKKSFRARPFEEFGGGKLIVFPSHVLLCYPYKQ